MKFTGVGLAYYKRGYDLDLYAALREVLCPLANNNIIEEVKVSGPSDNINLIAYLDSLQTLAKKNLSLSKKRYLYEEAQGMTRNKSKKFLRRIKK